MMVWRCVEEDTPVFPGRHQLSVHFSGVSACREGLNFGIRGVEASKRSRPCMVVLPATLQNGYLPLATKAYRTNNSPPTSHGHNFLHT
jgi:hypothetical protein